MPSNDRADRGLPLPTIGTCVVLAAALCAAWLFWTNSEDRSPSPEIEPTADEAVTRIQALEALIQRGRDGVPELMSGLSDPDPKVRRGALVALGRIGPEAEEALPLVQDALNDPDETVRSSAVTAFGRITPEAGAAVPVIARLLADPTAQVRDAAIATLIQAGAAAMDHMLGMLHSDSPAARAAALRIAWRVSDGSPPPEVVAAARELTADCDEEVRMTGLEFVVRLGLGTPNDVRELLRVNRELTLPAVPRGLVLGSNAPDAAARDGPIPAFLTGVLALQAIAAMGPKSAELIPDLLDLVEKEGENAIGEGLLGGLRTAAPFDTAQVLARAGRMKPAPRLSIVGMLLDIGVQPETVIPMLIQLLDSDSPESPDFGRPVGSARFAGWDRYLLCRWAGELLVRAGPDEARRQVSRLVPKLQSTDSEILLPVLNALRGLAPVAEEAAPELARLAARPDRDVGDVGWYAAIVLGEIGPAGAAATPFLIEQLRRTSYTFVQSHFIDVLGKIGPGAREAAPVLAEILSEHRRALEPETDAERASGVSLFAVEVFQALGRIADNSPPIVTELRVWLKDRSPLARAAAIATLAAVERNSRSILGELLPFLADDSPEVRTITVIAIGKLAGDGRAAVAPLTKRLKDDNAGVRAAAATSLGRIGPAAKHSLPVLRGLLEDQASGPLGGWLGEIAEPNQLLVMQAARNAISAIEEREDLNNENGAQQ
jgi:HEAT repeat protein